MKENNSVICSCVCVCVGLHIGQCYSKEMMVIHLTILAALFQGKLRPHMHTHTLTHSLFWSTHQTKTVHLFTCSLITINKYCRSNSLVWSFFPKPTRHPLRDPRGLCICANASPSLLLFLPWKVLTSDRKVNHTLCRSSCAYGCMSVFFSVCGWMYPSIFR